MVTLHLEVVDPKSINVGFYNPAPETFRAYPRTENGVKKAIRRLKKLALSLETVTDFRVACYDGKKEYWNKKPFIGYINKQTIIANF